MPQVYNLEEKITTKGTIQLPKQLLHLRNRKVKLSVIDDQETKQKNWLDLIESHAIEDDELPEDYSVNFDHYLYGFSKKKNIEK